MLDELRNLPFPVSVDASLLFHLDIKALDRADKPLAVRSASWRHKKFFKMNKLLRRHAIPY